MKSNNRPGVAIITLGVSGLANLLDFPNKPGNYEGFWIPPYKQQVLTNRSY